jgi:hypothetical protein
MRLFLLVTLLSCREVTEMKELVGEVHIHGFPGGVHPAALFVRPATPSRAVEGDSVLVDPSAQREGDCLVVRSSDAAPPEPRTINGGALRILGGSGISRVDLELRGDSGYVPVDDLPHRELFAGGERITIVSEGAEAPAFRGTIEAPRRLAIRAPRKLTRAAPLTVEWEPDHAERIHIGLVVSRGDGRWVAVRCHAADAAGRFTFPATLVAALPPAPRDLQLEVRRDQIVRVPTATPSTGVILHASFAANLTGHEP